MGGLRISLFQYEVTERSVEDRLADLGKTVRTLAGRTDLLICPELFLPGYGNPAALKATSSNDLELWEAHIASLAREYGMAILYGCPEVMDGGRYNVAQCLDSNGRRLAQHRKMHLPNGYEKDLFVTDQGISCFELNGIRCALMICYDAEFPEPVRAAAQAGAQLIIVPTALVSDWVQVAERVMPARAFENGVYLAYVNFAGSEVGLEYCGRSCLVGPDGLDIARAGSKQGILTGIVDQEQVSKAQARLTYLRDVQPHYSIRQGDC